MAIINHKINHSLLLLISILLSFYFFTIIGQYTLNSPIFDDVEAFCGFLINYKNHGIAHTIRHLFLPSGDHIIFSGRFFSLIYYSIFGNLNFKNLILFSNLSILGIVFIFYQFFKKLHLKIYLFYPVLFVLINVPTWFNASFFLIETFQFPVFFLSIFLNFILLRNPKNTFFCGSILLTFLLTFSHSNGIFVWFSSIIFLVLSKEYKKSIIFSFFGIISIGLFVLLRAKSPPIDLHNLGVGHLKNMFVGVFSYLGLYFDFIPIPFFKDNIRVIVPVIFGVFSTGMIIFLLVWELRKKQKINEHWELRILIFSFITFFWFTSAVIGVFRSLENPYLILENSLHYRSSSAMLLVLVYLYLLSFRPQKMLFYNSFLLIVISIFVVSNFTIYGKIKTFYFNNLANAINQKNNQEGLMGELGTPAGDYTFGVLEQSKKYGIYEIPDYPEYDKLLDTKSVVPQDSLSYTMVIQNPQIMFKTDLGKEEKSIFESNLFLILTTKPTERKQIFYCKQNLLNLNNPFNIYKSTQHSAILYQSSLAKGLYAVHFAQKVGSEIKYFKAKDLVIPPH